MWSEKIMAISIRGVMYYILSHVMEVPTEKYFHFKNINVSDVLISDLTSKEFQNENSRELVWNPKPVVLLKHLKRYNIKAVILNECIFIYNQYLEN